MPDTHAKKARRNAGGVTIVFLFNILIFGGAFLYEVTRAWNDGGVAGLSRGPGTAMMALWMSPFLALTFASVIGLMLTQRTMRGDVLGHANAKAVGAIGIGISIAGLIQGLMALYATYQLPALLGIGGKQPLYNVALLSFGSLLQMLALSLRSAADIKAENDQIL